MAKAPKKPAGADVSEIVLENIGPVHEARIPVQPGRVTRLLGSNGAGKSETLKAIQALAHGGVPLEKTDGAETGEITGLGITIKIGRNGANRRTGELEVVSVEDGFDLAKFVDPGLKDAAAADKHRIKALAAMLAVKVTPGDVKGLLGDDLYKRTLTDTTRSATGAVDYVNGVKKDCDQTALDAEKEAARLSTEAATLEATINGLDLTAESDETKLKQALEDAMTRKSALAERVRLAGESGRVADAARLLLDDKSGLTFADAVTAHNEAKAEQCASQKTIQELETKLAAERGRLEQIDRRVRDASQAEDAAKLREESRQKATEALGQTIAAPTLDELENAANAVEAAQANLIAGDKIRAANATQKRIDALRAEAAGEQEIADRLRRAAAGTSELLAGPINAMKCGIRVDSQMRLVVEGHRRQNCYMSDLSPGEGWSIALALVSKAFEAAGVPGLLAVPQEAFEGLDGHNMNLFLEAVGKTKLMVITAKASPTDDFTPVTAEII